MCMCVCVWGGGGGVMTIFIELIIDILDKNIHYYQHIEILMQIKEFHSSVLNKKFIL